jgi:hypothetical protein
VEYLFTTFLPYFSNPDIEERDISAEDFSNTCNNKTEKASSH